MTKPDFMVLVPDLYHRRRRRQARRRVPPDPPEPQGHFLGHSPTVFDFLRKMEGQNFLHSIQVYTHVHRFPSRLTPVKGPPVTQ